VRGSTTWPPHDAFRFRLGLPAGCRAHTVVGTVIAADGRGVRRRAGDPGIPARGTPQSCPGWTRPRRAGRPWRRPERLFGRGRPRTLWPRRRRWLRHRIESLPGCQSRQSPGPGPGRRAWPGLPRGAPAFLKTAATTARYLRRAVERGPARGRGDAACSACRQGQPAVRPTTRAGQVLRRPVADRGTDHSRCVQASRTPEGWRRTPACLESSGGRRTRGRTPLRSHERGGSGACYGPPHDSSPDEHCEGDRRRGRCDDDPGAADSGQGDRREHARGGVRSRVSDIGCSCTCAETPQHTDCRHQQAQRVLLDTRRGGGRGFPATPGPPHEDRACLTKLS